MTTGTDAPLDRIEELEAKLAEASEDRDNALIALASARKQLERYIGEAEALVEAAKEVKADCIARADKNGVVPIGRTAWDRLTAALSAL